MEKKKALRRAAEEEPKGNGIKERFCAVGYVFMP